MSAVAPRVSAKFKPYPAYRDSGVEWLGQVPEHWEVKPAKAVFRERRELSSSSDIHLTPSQAYGVLPQSEYIQLTGGSVVLNLEGADNMKHVEPGDFIIHLRSFQGGIEFSPLSGKVSMAYTVLRPSRHIETGFFKWLLKSQIYIQALRRTTDQMRDGQSIKFSQFALNALPVPALTEQQAIAALLDRETAKIDALIEKKRRLIELLKEKRAALISHAVTKGLDPSAPMKDSGIPWLGEIPAHWEVKPLDSLASVKGRLGWKGLKADEYVDVGFGFLSTPNIKDDEGVDFSSAAFITAERYFESPEIMLAPGDVLLAKDGSTLGTVNWIRELPFATTVNSSIAVVRSRGSVLPEYLFRWFQTRYMEETIETLKGGMGVPHLFQSDIRKFRVLLPPVSEQAEVCTYLMNTLGRLRRLAEALTMQISKFQEYRYALISAAVTGKIDVRGDY